MLSSSRPTGSARATRSRALIDGLAAVLRGEDVAWRALAATPGEVLQACIDEDLTCLVHRRLCSLRGDWPISLRDELARRSSADAATELLRRREIVAALETLASEDIRPILLKGTALAYVLYDEPHMRPRCDTDLLVRREDVDRVRLAMSKLSYIAPTYCDGELLFCQFALEKTDDFGVDHAFDFHWKISTQPIFVNVMAYHEVADCARPVPALGPHARSAGPVHALLLACIHPVMHHRNVQRLIWIYDLHLLASRLSESELGRFLELAVETGVASICARQLIVARARFGTPIPDDAIARLAACRNVEPSSAYLRPARRWRHEMVSSIRGLQRWTDRLRLLREVLLPSRDYMMRAYRLPPVAVNSILLPILYAHRLVRGGFRIVTGQK